MMQNYIFNGNENEFIEHLVHFWNNQFSEDLSVQVIGNKIHIKRKLAETMIVSFQRTNYCLRTFSIPVKIPYSIRIFSCDKIDPIIEKAVCDVCDAYSPKEIEAVLNDMPLLNAFSRKEKDISEYSIIWRDHFLEENIGLLSAFVRSGIKPQNILALDKGDSTKHRMEIEKTFKLLGYNTNILDNINITCTQCAVAYKQILASFLSNKKDGTVVILDDGAIVTSLLEKQFEQKIKFAVELTEMGLRRIKALDKLPCRVYNLAKTDLKKLFTYKEVGNSVFTRVIEILGACKLIGRTIVIIGFGDLGEMLARNFRNFGARVVVTDIDYKRLVLAAELGYTTYEKLHESIVCESPFMVMGTSGYESIQYSDLQEMPTGSYVTSAATADVKVFDKMDGAILSRIEGFGTRYNIDGKVVTLLGNGRSINLFDSEAIPNQANDLFKAATLITLINGLQETSDKKELVLEQVNKWLEVSRIYKKYYELYFIRK